MNCLSFLSVAGSLVLFSSSAIAQSQSGKAPERPADGGTREVLISILIPSLPNAPFTAILHTTAVRRLADGTEIKVWNQRKIARDKLGRIFQERRGLIPDNGKDEPPLAQIEISDPVKRELYICRPQEKVCQLEYFEPPEGMDLSVLGKKPSGPGVEDLGKQMILGLETVGTRQVRVIQTGEIGNDRPLLAKREFWFSPRLGVNVLSTREDPTSGMQRFEVSELVLEAADEKLFEPPEGSTILDLRKTVEIPAQNPAPN